MNLTIEGKKTQFYQWDTGQRLIVGVGETCQEVHFCRSSDESALVCRVREENGQRVVDVPNILLQEAEKITAYMLITNKDGVETRWENSFDVQPRPKPEDYIYTETEVLNYASLDKRLESLEGEGIGNAVADYLKEHPVAAGATKEEAQQIQKNKEDIAQLTRDKLSLSGGTMGGKIVFPTGDQNVGFANTEDMKIFGYGTVNGAVYMRMGDPVRPFQIRGSGVRPKYNDSEMAIMSDIPTDTHINGLINTALGVIENGTY